MFIDGIINQYNPYSDKWFKYVKAEFTIPGKFYKFGSVTIITKKMLNFRQELVHVNLESMAKIIITGYF